MKILQVNCVYNKGSTGKMVADIHDGLLERGIKSVVCYGRGQKLKDTKIYKTCGEFYSHVNKFVSELTGIMYGGCWFSTNRLISIIKKEKPDIIHLHCINGYFVNIYRLISWLKRNNIKTVLTLHAEFMFTGGCGYATECEQWRSERGCGKPSCPRWRRETGSVFFDRTSAMWKRMKKAFDGFTDLAVVSVSPWLFERAKASPILSDKKHYVVLNGVNTQIFRSYEPMDFSRNRLAENQKIIFHATPDFNDNPNHRKGGYYLIELAKKMPDVIFIVAGRYAPDLVLPENVILLGTVENQVNLAKYYSMADLTLLLSKRETFSMVTVESLCCGTPVAGFKSGGPESVALSEFSKFVDYGNIDLLKKVVTEMLNSHNDKRLISEMARQTYSKETMCDNLITVYKNMN